MWLLFVHKNYTSIFTAKSFGSKIYCDASKKVYETRYYCCKHLQALGGSMHTYYLCWSANICFSLSVREELASVFHNLPPPPYTSSSLHCEGSSGALLEQFLSSFFLTDSLFFAPFLIVFPFFAVLLTLFMLLEFSWVSLVPLLFFASFPLHGLCYCIVTLFPSLLITTLIYLICHFIIVQCLMPLSCHVRVCLICKLFRNISYFNTEHIVLLLLPLLPLEQFFLKSPAQGEGRRRPQPTHWRWRLGGCPRPPPRTTRPGRRSLWRAGRGQWQQSPPLRWSGGHWFPPSPCGSFPSTGPATHSLLSLWRTPSSWTLPS